MKTTLKLALLLILNSAAVASETNVVYLPYEQASYFGEEIKVAAYKRAVKAARDLPECKPAEFDPEGHWGEIEAGLQMSIRFAKRVFTAREHIEATVIIRNTTTNYINVLAPITASIELIVLNNRKEPAGKSRPELVVSGPSSLLLPGRRQIKFQLLLNNLPSQLTAGETYYVYARRRVSEHLGESVSNLKSAQAKIRIIEETTNPSTTE
jgi:hypothetical protein